MHMVLADIFDGETGSSSNLIFVTLAAIILGYVRNEITIMVSKKVNLSVDIKH